MDMEMAMDMMDQEEIIRAISQLDRALACCLHASPSTSPPPQQQPLLVHQAPPSNPLILPVRMPAPVTPPVSPNGAARPRRRRGGACVSSERQSVVAARLRRERVSQRMRALQRLVPGGARLDTASMLEEAIRYVRFLKSHVQALEQLAEVATMVQDGAAAAAVGGFSSCPPPYHA